MDITILTVDEVAERLRVNPATVRRWCREGTLKATQLPGARGSWRITPEALAELVGAA